MGKTNYTKTENLLNEALLKMTVEELLRLADHEERESLPSVQARSIILSMMEHDLTQLSQVPEASLTDLGMTSKELKSLSSRVKELTSDEWTLLKQVRERLLAYKKELWEKIPHLTDDALIEKERKKHINKRFNTREKWLPLH